MSGVDAQHSGIEEIDKAAALADESIDPKATGNQAALSVLLKTETRVYERLPSGGFAVDAMELGEPVPVKGFFVSVSGQPDLLAFVSLHAEIIPDA